VDRSGALILARDRAVVLEGILLPGAEDGGSGRLLADETYVALSQLAGGPLTVAARPPQTDRYDRLRAQAFGAVWLQKALLERGLARVMIAPDRSDCAPELYAAESQARQAKRGLWALPAYRVRQAAESLKADAGTFQIVEGKVAHVGLGAGRTFLDFSQDWRNGFSAVIAAEDRKTFRHAHFDLGSLSGRRIRLRGTVELFGGRPEIALSNPAQIELLN
jgi:hypothetical protein